MYEFEVYWYGGEYCCATIVANDLEEAIYIAEERGYSPEEYEVRLVGLHEGVTYFVQTEDCL